MALSIEKVGLPKDFPLGLRVLVIDNDNNFLKAFEKMCLQFHYQVTTCSKASDALNILKKKKSSFDVIVIEVQMQDIDSYNFLQLISQEIKVPVIVMCVDGSVNTMLRAIEKGACECWIKPLNANQIKIMWQHVARNYFNENKKQETNKEKLEVEGKREIERIDATLEGVNNIDAPKPKENGGVVEIVETEENKNKDEHEPPTKKARVVWSEELHQKFISAVTELGGVDKAVPRKIVELMNGYGLTREHVASHLQKFRIHLKAGETQKKQKNHQNGKAVEYNITGSSSELDFQAYVTHVEVPKQNQNQNNGILKSALWSNNYINNSQTKQDPIAYGCSSSQLVVPKKNNDEYATSSRYRTWNPVIDQYNKNVSTNVMWNKDMQHHQSYGSMMISGTDSYQKKENISPDSINDQMNYGGGFNPFQNTHGDGFLLGCNPPQPLPISSFTIGASRGFSPLSVAGLYEMDSNIAAEEALSAMYG